MKTAKLFMIGEDQAVRLPDEFRMEGDEVYIAKVGNSIVLTPKNAFDWEAWFKALSEIDVDIDFDRP